MRLAEGKRKLYEQSMDRIAEAVTEPPGHTRYEQAKARITRLRQRTERLKQEAEYPVPMLEHFTLEFGPNKTWLHYRGKKIQVRL